MTRFSLSVLFLLFSLSVNSKAIEGLYIDNATKFHSLMKQAKSGNDESMRTLFTLVTSEPKYYENEFPDFFQLLLKKSSEGEATSQFWLGVIYWAGVNLPQDLKEAENWLTRASNQGVKQATVRLGLVQLAQYELSNPKSKMDDVTFNKISYNLKLSIELNYVQGLVALGLLFVNEKQDLKQARKYLQLAMNLGSRQASIYLERIDKLNSH